MVKVKNLELIINKNHILNNINVEFEKGKITGLVGRNGSGKTMLMKCICGFVKKTSGEIFVNGKQIGKDVDFSENTGVIIETPGFIPFYSGYRNLKLLADLKGVIGKSEIYKTMRTVGLDPELKRHVSKYSLGMRQRLGIAQAIMERPTLLILDEPMNGLDTDGVEDVRKLLLDLKNDGTTVILASHTKEDIEILCDRVYEMSRGILK